MFPIFIVNFNYMLLKFSKTSLSTKVCLVSVTIATIETIDKFLNFQMSLWNTYSFWWSDNVFLLWFWFTIHYCTFYKCNIGVINHYLGNSIDMTKQYLKFCFTKFLIYSFLYTVKQYTCCFKCLVHFVLLKSLLTAGSMIIACIGKTI